ncbi:hypothetical protein [Paraburkholderia sartisoli]|nr:hypothetical protein [Paraburkholderia sartisoli]
MTPNLTRIDAEGAETARRIIQIATACGVIVVALVARLVGLL